MSNAWRGLLPKTLLRPSTTTLGRFIETVSWYGWNHAYDVPAPSPLQSGKCRRRMTCRFPIPGMPRQTRSVASRADGCDSPTWLPQTAVICRRIPTSACSKATPENRPTDTCHRFVHRRHRLTPMPPACVAPHDIRRTPRPPFWRAKTTQAAIWFYPNHPSPCSTARMARAYARCARRSVNPKRGIAWTRCPVHHHSF